MNFAQFAGFQATLALPQFAVSKFQSNQDPIPLHGVQIGLDENPHSARIHENSVKVETCENVSDYFMRFSGQPTFPSNLNLYAYKPSPTDMLSKEHNSAAPTVNVGAKNDVVQKKTKKKKKRQNSSAGGEHQETRKRSTSLQPVISSTVEGHTLFSCPQCHSIFHDQESVNGHMAIHRMERPFICEDCGAALKRKEHLDRHKSSHMTERPFCCHVCSKSFKRQEHLHRHSIIHRTDKAHHCVECGKGFNRKDHLNKHVQSHLSKRLKQEITPALKMISHSASDMQV